MGTQREIEETTEMVIVSIDDHLFQCDRNILSRLSGYFRAMFSNSFSEATQDLVKMTSDENGFISSEAIF